MPQPTPYARTTDFSDEESAAVSGRSTIRTAALDAELDAVQTNLQGLNTNIALIQRDDGKVRDGVVQLHTLAPDVAALMAASNAASVGPWQAGVLYRVRSVVASGGGTYIAAVEHTSGTFAADLAAGRWVAIYQEATGIDAAGVDFLPTWTGAVERAVSARLSDTMHVRDFGVVADGVADDTNAIRAAHTAANALGRALSYEGISTLAVQANAYIVINTDVDFAGCRFILLGGVDPTPDYDDINTVFHVYDSTRPVVVASTPIAESSYLKAGGRWPTRGAFDGPGFAELSCSAFQVPNRATTGTMNYRQCFSVLRTGWARLPLAVDLSASRLACSVLFRRDSLKPIKIENAIFPATGWNNQYLFRVERNEVWFDRLSFPADEAVAPYESIDACIYAFRVSDLKITNVKGPARSRDRTLSSYLLNVTSGANIVLEDFTGFDGWGATGNNDINGLFVARCDLNRVDCHSGAFNIFVSDSTLQAWGPASEYGGVQYGWGGGIISVTDTHLNWAPAITAREDYGGTFFGAMVVKNVIVNHAGVDDYVCVSLENMGASSMPVHCPHTVTVDGVQRVGGPLGVAPVSTMEPVRVKTAVPATQVVHAPALIEVRNIRSFPGWSFASRFDLYNMEPAVGANNRLRFHFENIPADTVASTANVDGVTAYAAVRTPTNRIRPRFEVNNCWNFYLEVRYDVPEFEVFMNGGSLNGIIRDTGFTNQPRVHLRGVELANNVTGTSPAPVGGTTSATSGHTCLSDCYISSSNFDLSLVASFDGCIVRSGASPTLPAGVTTADLFNGWRRASTFA